MKKNNIFKKDYYKKYKDLRKAIAGRAKDSGFNFKQSYIKNIKIVSGRLYKDFFLHDYEFSYKDKKYLCQELEFYKFKTIQID